MNSEVAKSRCLRARRVLLLALPCVLGLTVCLAVVSYRASLRGDAAILAHAGQSGKSIPSAHARDVTEVDPLVEHHVSALVDARSDEVVSGASLPGGPETSQSQRKPDEVTQDQEWSTIPRTNFPLAALVLGTYPREHRLASAESVARHLYRNVYLNPGDNPIPVIARKTLAPAIGPLLEKVTQARGLAGRTGVKEFRDQLQAGKQPSIDLSNREALDARLTDDERLQLASMREQVKQSYARAGGKLPEGKEPEVVVPEIMFKGKDKPVTFTVRDGKLYSATLDELPSAKRVMDLENYFMLELANAVLEWFAIQGCLGPEQKRAKLDQTVTMVLGK